MKIKKILLGIIIVLVLYVIGTQVLSLLISNGITNARSDESMLKADEIYLLPQEVLDNKGVKFTLDGINNRKAFTDSVATYSEMLGIDKDLVMACVVAEQIRISSKGVRGNLKGLILNSTPKLLRSYNVSLGIGGIKLDTARQIRNDAIKYKYDFFDQLLPDILTTSGLADNDRLNAKYATYLIKNIITRRQLSGYYIAGKPGIVCTIYNFGNHKDKHPNANPKIGGAVIPIAGKNYTYGAIGLGVYYYLKLNQ